MPLQRTSSITQRVDDLMRFSGLVNTIMEVQRATLRENRPETDGEHTLHLQFIAVVYAARYHPELDIGKIALYALVHDFVEAYAGDVNSLSATVDELELKDAQEKIAFDRLQKELGEVWPEFISLIHNYETLVDAEARFVKCFDKCDPAFTHYTNQGEALHRMGITNQEDFERATQRVGDRMAHYSTEFPEVLEVRQELLKRVSDVTYPTV